MPFTELKIKGEYRSLIDNVTDDFLIPLLGQSVMYKRAVGFFSSSSLAKLIPGLIGLIRKNGRIRLIASPALNEEDIAAIRQGYSERDVIKTALIRELKDPVDSIEENRLNLLANLIKDGYLDIKIAITSKTESIGMYHEKVGVFIDTDGNKVAFSGSMNETANAFSGNYETIDVFCSWKPQESDRVVNKETAFDRIWDNREINVHTFEFNDVSEEIIRRYKRSSINYKDYAEKEKGKNFFSIPSFIALYEYQNKAIENWASKGYRGIFDMATGTGKTYTALGALANLSETCNGRLAVIILVPYQHLVEQWNEDIRAFNVSPIKAYSYSGQKWEKEFQNAASAYNVGAIKNFCVITTNSSFCTEKFQTILKGLDGEFCIVADEAHNLGASKIQKLLPDNAKYRLALSATVDRFYDEEGTGIIKKYFGEKCIEYSLREAILNGFLCTYYYYPVLVNLSSDEYEEYAELTESINHLAPLAEENLDYSKQLKRLLIERARIVAGCKQKVDKLLDIIEPFKNETHMLIYCGATWYEDSLSDEGAVRQIDEINFRLYHDLGMKVRKFTAEESKEEREEIRQMFVDEDIQAITAIKCLDEGVNIPSIKKAFILASSTNPREYIQRRGRVLRNAPGKDYAVIYDFITLPRKLSDVCYVSPKEKECDLTLVRKEFKRMNEFADMARNPFEIDTIKEKILNNYSINVGGDSNGRDEL